MTNRDINDSTELPKRAHTVFDYAANQRIQWWFLLVWLIPTIPTAFFMSLVGFAFSKYHGPNSLYEVVEFVATFIVGLLAVAPVFAIVALLAVTLVIVWREFRNPFSHSRNAGTLFPVCIKCKYDLTCNTTGRCPECGAPTTGAVPSNRFWWWVLLFNLLGVGYWITTTLTQFGSKPD